MNNTPVFGKYVNLIHPFDMFELIENNKDIKLKQIGETGIPINSDNGCYLSQAGIFEFGDKIYVQTTTVKPVTDRFK